jgi:dTMP kinase
MALWSKLKTELDRAGRVAQDALDEGKTRLEAFRARQLADKAAQALGYAVYRARKNGGELEADTYTRLATALATHEETAARLEKELRDASPADGTRDKAADAPSKPPAADASPPDAQASPTPDAAPPQA